MAISRGFQLKIFTAYDYLGQRMHWLILASRLDQEFSFNIDQKRFEFVLRSDSTEPRNLSRLFHSMRLTVLRKFFNFPLRWLEGDSLWFCLIDSFFLIKLSMAPYIPRYGIPSLKPLGLYIVRDHCKKSVFPLMPVSIYIVIGYDRRKVNC